MSRVWTENKFNLRYDGWTQIAEDYTENIDFSQPFPSKNITFARYVLSDALRLYETLSERS